MLWIFLFSDVTWHQDLKFNPLWSRKKNSHFLKLSYSLQIFPPDVQQVVFHWSLSDNKSLQVSGKQKKYNCRLFGDRDETVNHIISNCCKMAKKKKLQA